MIALHAYDIALINSVQSSFQRRYSDWRLKISETKLESSPSPENKTSSGAPDQWQNDCLEDISQVPRGGLLQGIILVQRDLLRARKGEGSIIHVEAVPQKSKSV